MIAGDGSGKLPWRELTRQELLDARIFRVSERENEGPDGRRGRFVVLEAPDWATVVPLLHREGQTLALMVRQYRHGSAEASLEFPGGVVEPGEHPADAARRELEEETGFTAGRLTPLGDISPNPAIMDNRFHVFLAEELRESGKRALDEHEIVDALLLPFEEVLARMGRGECRHALMVAAAFLAERELRERQGGAGFGLIPLSADDYPAYRASLIEELAAGCVANGLWSAQEAEARAAVEQDAGLPQGVETPGNFLYAIEAKARRVGRLWFGRFPDGSSPEIAFLYHIEVSPEERGQGYGAKALRAAAQAARAEGFRALRLHVFRDNSTAKKLYDAAGFRPIREDPSGWTLELPLD